MKIQQKAKEKILEEIGTFEGKLQELKSLVQRNGVPLEVIVNRAKKDSDNFRKKIEAIEKMASKERR